MCPHCCQASRGSLSLAPSHTRSHLLGHGATGGRAAGQGAPSLPQVARILPPTGSALAMLPTGEGSGWGRGSRSWAPQSALASAAAASCRWQPVLWHCWVGAGGCGPWLWGAWEEWGGCGLGLRGTSGARGPWVGIEGLGVWRAVD